MEARPTFCDSAEVHNIGGDGALGKRNANLTERIHTLRILGICKHHLEKDSVLHRVGCPSSKLPGELGLWVCHEREGKLPGKQQGGGIPAVPAPAPLKPFVGSNTTTGARISQEIDSAIPSLTN